MPTVPHCTEHASPTHLVISLITTILVCCSLGQFAFGQQQPTPSRTLFASSNQSPQTPAATLSQFCKAVRAKDWECEFLCYSESRRSRFTYFVIRGIDELEGEVDLLEKADALIREFNIPKEAFTKFPSMRSENTPISTIDFQTDLNRRLTEWRSEIYPHVKNWPEFIKRLQPILEDNHTRHSNDITHPSQTGIVSHLNFHYFDHPKNLVFSESQGEATIVAIVRDPDWQPLEDTSPDSNRKSYGDQIQETLFKLVKGRNIRRAEEKIQLILEANEWRIDSVPFR